MRVTFYTLGCKVNQNETGALAQLFEENGYTVVSNEEGADVYIVNSCTVTNFGDQKSRKWLRRAKRENPGAVTVLTGCYPQAFPDEAAEIAEADVVTGSGNRHAILTDVQKVLNGEEERVVDIRPHEKGERFEELPWISLPSTPAPLSRSRTAATAAAPTALFRAPAVRCAAAMRRACWRNCAAWPTPGIRRSC